MKKGFHISRLKPSALQGRIDFDTVSRRRTAVLAVEYRAERYAFTLFASLLFILICGYFYFVIGSVFNVIAEKQADVQSNNLQGAIASLEQQYFALNQSLTPEAAAQMGLTPIQTTSYVYRPGNAAEAQSSVHAI